MAPATGIADTQPGAGRSWSERSGRDLNPATTIRSCPKNQDIRTLVLDEWCGHPCRRLPSLASCARDSGRR